MLRLHRSLSFKAALRAAAISLSTLACAAGHDASAGAEREAVIGGTVSGSEDDAVVRIVARQPEPYDDGGCTGVLLAPNVLLTALHCVSVYDGPAVFSCRTDGTLDPSWDGGWIGQTLDPASIEVYFGNAPSFTPDAHGARVFGTGATAVCVDDVALVVLDTPLPSRGVPIRIGRPVVDGELMTVVGFGPSGLPGDSIRSRRSDVPVVDVGPDDTTHGVGTVAPRAFIVGEGPCLGDNGAPALSEETGAVTGVFLFGLSKDCTQPGALSWFAKVAPYTHLLDDAFRAAGGHPVAETTATPSAPPARAASCAFTSSAGSPAAGAALALVVMLLARRHLKAPAS